MSIRPSYVFVPIFHSNLDIILNGSWIISSFPSQFFPFIFISCTHSSRVIDVMVDVILHLILSLILSSWNEICHLHTFSILSSSSFPPSSFFSISFLFVVRNIQPSRSFLSIIPWENIIWLVLIPYTPTVLTSLWKECQNFTFLYLTIISLTNNILYDVVC